MTETAQHSIEHAETCAPIMGAQAEKKHIQVIIRDFRHRTSKRSSWLRWRSQIFDSGRKLASSWDRKIRIQNIIVIIDIIDIVGGRTVCLERSRLWLSNSMFDKGISHSGSSDSEEPTDACSRSLAIGPSKEIGINVDTRPPRPTRRNSLYKDWMPMV
jgi:hypothetical protein